MRHAIDLKKAKPEKLTGGDNIAIFLIMESSINMRPSVFLVKPVLKSANEDTLSLSGTLDFPKLLIRKK